jgi:hypothetical protein
MNGHLRIVGLVLIVGTAACAVLAITSSADEAVPWDFKADGDYVKYTGALVEKEKMAGDGGTITCNEVTYESEEPEEEAAATDDTLIAVKPRKGGCLGNGIPVEFDTKSCKYLFHADLATPTATEGSVDIVCNVKKDELTFTEIAPGGTLKCTIHVPQQDGLNDVTFTNGVSGGVKDITVDLNLTAVKYTQTAGTGVGACANLSATQNGTILENFTLKGDNKAGTATDIWVEHT